MAVEETGNKTFRVMMWCPPRSISTAITKCISFVNNCQIYFEPYWCKRFQSCLARSSGWHPVSEEALSVETYLARNYKLLNGTSLEEYFNPNKIDTSLIAYKDIVEQLTNIPGDRSVFVKDISEGIEGNHHHLPSASSGFKYTFLIRDPGQLYPSFRNLMFNQNRLLFGHDVILDSAYDFLEANPLMDDGYYYRSHYELWKYVKEFIDPDPVVIDCDELLAHPAELLPKFLGACGIPWNDRLLHWDPSPDTALKWRTLFPLVQAPSAQGRMSDSSHGNHTAAAGVMTVAHKGTMSCSTFRSPIPKISRSEMTPDVIRAVDTTSGYYEEMAATRITVG